MVQERGAQCCSSGNDGYPARVEGNGDMGFPVPSVVGRGEEGCGGVNSPRWKGEPCLSRSVMGLPAVNVELRIRALHAALSQTQQQRAVQGALGAENRLLRNLDGCADSYTPFSGMFT